MTPGRELDALIAEKVMGEKIYRSLDGIYWLHNKNYRLPNYSTDIAAAWEVVEKLPCNTVALFYHDAYVQWECRLDYQRCVYEDTRISAMADTAPHAICLAALKLKGIDFKAE